MKSLDFAKISPVSRQPVLEASKPLNTLQLRFQLIWRFTLWQTYERIFFIHYSSLKRRGPILEVLQCRANPWRRWSKPLTQSRRAFDYLNSFNTSTSLHRYTLQTAKSTKQCSLGTPKFSLNNPLKKKKWPKNLETTHKLDFCAGKRLGFPLVLLKSFVCQQHCLNVFWEL